MGLAQNPDYATQVTLQPLARFPLDAAILFSDILTIPDAMGLGLSFAEGEGPRFARPLRDEAAIAALAVPDMQALDYVFRAVAQIKRELAGRVPLIGFAGSPFTLACYMIEGGGSGDFALSRRMAYARPDLLAHLVGVNARAVEAYLHAQVDHGADAVMVFDTWGGLLSAGAFAEFSLAPMRRVVASLAHRVPTIVFTRGGGAWLPDIAGIGASCVGIDWTVDIASARASVGTRVAIQGNLDPVALLTDAATVVRESERIVRAAGPQPGHVFNLGHGIVPATPPDHVAALIETVHRVSRETRAGA
jgi:uroporphyrinogen decarboxylase